MSPLGRISIADQLDLSKRFSDSESSAKAGGRRAASFRAAGCLVRDRVALTELGDSVPRDFELLDRRADDDAEEVDAARTEARAGQ